MKAYKTRKALFWRGRKFIVSAQAVNWSDHAQTIRASVLAKRYAREVEEQYFSGVLARYSCYSSEAMA